jgi:hypothetical protein
MSQSFSHLIDGMIETIRSRIMPQLDDASVRGQAYGVIYALEGLKLSADWAIAPLIGQILLQDKAFAEVSDLARGLDHPEIPSVPRVAANISEGADLERLRNDGDRKLGALLLWTSSAAAKSDPGVARAIEQVLRRIMREQLKIDISIMPKSMFHELATGQESTAAKSEN